MKKYFIFVSIFFTATLVFAQNKNTSKSVEKFLKGNIQDKTVAVREASDDDAVWLCDKAVSFILDSKEILGNDRELDGLAVAAILSYPQSYVRTVSDSSKENLLNDFITLFESFSSSPNVQVTVISKLNSLSRDLRLTPFIKKLNRILSEESLLEMDTSVVKSIINFLSIHGDSESFSLAYNLWCNERYLGFIRELENAVVSLLPVSMNDAVKIVENSTQEEIIEFYNLLKRNRNRINANYFCLLAENVLSKTILLVRKSQSSTSAVNEVQISCVQVLGEYKWSRASRVVIDYFDLARSLYASGNLSEEDFIKVIVSLGETAPLDAVPALIEYLEVLNLRVEKSEAVSEDVALGVINTLGAIGDKSAFDSLLGVTYYNYPQTVLAAARDALSALRW